MAEFTEKYRPRKLSELLGQTAVQRQAEGMLRSKRIPRTILITGPFGVGKSSLALILASKFNRQSYRRAAAEVAEFDIGIMRGIDNVRDITAAAQFAPRRRYRIIILDEIHRLTPAAAPALLKSIEQGPPRTIWLLVTAHPEQLLPEAVRRCYPINLRQPKPGELLPLLRRVCQREQLQLPRSDKLLRAIAEVAQGQPASALHLLQAAADHNAAGSDYREILRQAIRATPAVAVQVLAAKLLVWLYRKNSARVIREIPLEADIVSLSNALVNLNHWLLNHRAGRQLWRSPATSQLANYTSEISLPRMVRVQTGLLNLRADVQRFILPELPLITARLAQLAVESR